MPSFTKYRSWYKELVFWNKGIYVFLFLKSRFACTDKLRRDVSKINKGDTKGWQTLVHSGRTKNTIRNSGNPLPKTSWMRWSYFTFLAWNLLKPMKLIWNKSKHTWFFFFISWHYYKLLFVVTQEKRKTSMRSKSWWFEAKNLEFLVFFCRKIFSLFSEWRICIPSNQTWILLRH